MKTYNELAGMQRFFYEGDSNKEKDAELLEAAAQFLRQNNAIIFRDIAYERSVSEHVQEKPQNRLELVYEIMQ